MGHRFFFFPPLKKTQPTGYTRPLIHRWYLKDQLRSLPNHTHTPGRGWTCNKNTLHYQRLPLNFGKREGHSHLIQTKRSSDHTWIIKTAVKKKKEICPLPSIFSQKDTNKSNPDDDDFNWRFLFYEDASLFRVCIGGLVRRPQCGRIRLDYGSFLRCGVGLEVTPSVWSRLKLSIRWLTIKFCSVIRFMTTSLPKRATYYHLLQLLRSNNYHTIIFTVGIFFFDVSM